MTFAIVLTLVCLLIFGATLLVRMSSTPPPRPLPVTHADVLHELTTGRALEVAQVEALRAFIQTADRDALVALCGNRVSTDFDQPIENVRKLLVMHVGGLADGNNIRASQKRAAAL